MKLKILMLCMLTSAYALGQDTVLKKEKGESYYVLKSQPNIKHGPYQHSKKKKLIEKGQYDSGKKVGVWEYYDEDGNLEQKYDYSANQLIFNNERNHFFSHIIMEGKTTSIAPDTPPIFIGGLSSYLRFIEKNLKYPESAKSRGIEGRQFVLGSLSKEGEIGNTSIFRPITDDMDTEALRLIKELPKNWIPAKHQNENVNVLIQLPVWFKLP